MGRGVIGSSQGRSHLVELEAKGIIVGSVGKSNGPNEPAAFLIGLSSPLQAAFFPRFTLAHLLRCAAAISARLLADIFRRFRTGFPSGGVDVVR